jgi:hypothetical protein
MGRIGIDPVRAEGGWRARSVRGTRKINSAPGHEGRRGNRASVKSEEPKPRQRAWGSLAIKTAMTADAAMPALK